MSNASLSAGEKAKAMQDLMTSEWRAKYESTAAAPAQSSVTAEDKKPSYNTPPSGDKPGILGALIWPPRLCIFFCQFSLSLMAIRAVTINLFSEKTHLSLLSACFTYVAISYCVSVRTHTDSFSASRCYVDLICRMQALPTRLQEARRVLRKVCALQALS